jgi:hypothetical protein
MRPRVVVAGMVEEQPTHQRSPAADGTRRLL